MGDELGSAPRRKPWIVPRGPRSWEPLAKSKGAGSDPGSGGRKRQTSEPMYKKWI
jgi:hypothetical protein